MRRKEGAEREMKAETVFSQESFIRRADDDEVLELDAWEERRGEGGLWQMSNFVGLTCATDSGIIGSRSFKRREKESSLSNAWKY